MEEYRYTPLENSKTWMRLLSVPTLNDDSLSTSLTAVPLEQCPPYIALSYTWGPETPTHTIYVDGKQTEVRANLLSALQFFGRHVKSGKASTATTKKGDLGDTSSTKEKPSSTSQLIDSPHRWTYFWVDSICINQGDIDERNNQVALMGNLYTRADFVLVWLGLSDSDPASSSSRAMEIIAENDSEWLNNLVAANHTSPDYTSLEAFLNRDYWFRMWIIQEFTLGQDLLICCGDDTMQWDTLKAWHGPSEYVSSWKSSDLEFKKRWTRLMGKAEGVISYRQNFFGHTTNNKATFTTRFRSLDTFRQHKCYDKRDRIYGFLGLLQPYCPIVPDYRKTAEEIYQEVIASCSFGYPRDGMLLRDALGLPQTVKPDEHRGFSVRPTVDW